MKERKQAQNRFERVGALPDLALETSSSESSSDDSDDSDDTSSDEDDEDDEDDNLEDDLRSNPDEEDNEDDDEDPSEDSDVMAFEKVEIETKHGNPIVDEVEVTDLDESV